jgi:hypothetical protein
MGAARVGVYGSYDVMNWAKRDGVARWYWQTFAWSGGRWAGHNHLEQYRNDVSLAGGTVDLCRSKTADFGQWGVDDMALSDEDVAKIWSAPDPARDTNYGGALHAAHARAESAYAMTNILNSKLDAIAQKLDVIADPVNEQQIVAGLLAGLPAEAIAAAIPTDLAERVADLLATRLAS